MNYLQSLFGILVLLLCAVLLSENRKKISFKLVSISLGIQFIFAFSTKTSLVQNVFSVINAIVSAISFANLQAVNFTFGHLAQREHGFILAFQAFPVIITISALTALLFHFNILPFIINTVAKSIGKLFNIGSALSGGLLANLVVGISQSPLMIKPYLSQLTRSELFSLMCCGMSGIAASIMVVYVQILNDFIPNVAGHIATASLMSIPACLAISRIILPETNNITDGGKIKFSQYHNAIDAIANGIFDGGRIVMNILLIIIGFLSLVYLCNAAISVFNLPDHINSLQKIIGLIFVPITWLMGIDISEAQAAGSLLGSKLFMNELIAYQEFVAIAATLSMHTKIVLIYALCGFANFSSIGLLIGVYKIVAPDRLTEVTKLGLKALAAGTIANCISGTIISMIYL